jgi:hypothetical protein
MVRQFPDSEFPDGETHLWRFVDYSKFIWILQNQSLYFARADTFSDPYEGFPPVKHLEQKYSNSRRRRNEINERLSSGDGGEPLPEIAVDEFLASYRMFRKSSFLNCWYSSDEESESIAMWKQYLNSGDGVAVKTNYSDFLDSIKCDMSEDMYAGEVEYVDYESHEFAESNIFKCYLLKQKEYNYENEVRFLIYSPPPSSNDKELKPGGTLDLRWDGQPKGILLNVDLEDMIEEVVISPFSPEWVTKEQLECLLARHRVDIEVSESIVNKGPAERLD